MKINNIFKGWSFFAVIFFQQYFDFLADIFRFHSILTPYFIWQFLIISHSEP